MIHKALTLFTLSVFSVQMMLGDLALAQKQSQALPDRIQAIPYIDIVIDPARSGQGINIVKARQILEKDKETQEESFKKKRKELKEQKKTLQKELGKLNKQKNSPTTEQRRFAIRCEVLEIDKTIGPEGNGGSLALEQFQYATRLDNLFAKLDLLEKWPVEKQKTLEAIGTGKIKEEKFADVQDIGVRGGVFEDQGKDVELGKYAWEEALKNGEIRQDEIITDQQIINFLEKILAKLNTDNKTPIKLYVLNKVMTEPPFTGEPEINAAALPGGILMVNTGLIAYADNESELVGVLTHEMAHAAARHGHRILSRAGKLSLLQQLGQLAAMIFTGGSIGLIYAAIYGLQALGLAFTLNILGVSRAFELEADTLGAQYAYTSGYDPSGFINFFDKMATKFGYAQNTSFFGSHPAFSERISNIAKQLVYLRSLNLYPTEQLIVDTTEFQKIKTKTAQIIAKSKTELVKDSATRRRPTLNRKPQNVPACPGDPDPQSQPPTISDPQPNTEPEPDKDRPTLKRPGPQN